MSVGFKDWLNREYFAIESNPTYTCDQKVQHLIYTTAGICGVVAMQPLPFADIFALTPIQCYMGYKIARVRGVKLSEDEASDALKQIAGAVGMGFLAQQGVIGLYKLGLPFLGGFMTFPLVAGMTVGIGKAMDLYFRAQAEGKSISPRDLKQAYALGKQEGRNIQKPAIPAQSELEQSASLQQATTRTEEPFRPTPSSETSSSQPSFPIAPAVPTKKIDDLRKEYAKIFWSLKFADDALRRMVEFDGPDRRTLLYHFKLLDQGIIKPKHSIDGMLEEEAGADLRIYYRPSFGDSKREILLVGRKNTQKSDLKRAKSASA